jgi:hypothetical protein
MREQGGPLPSERQLDGTPRLGHVLDAEYEERYEDEEGPGVDAKRALQAVQDFVSEADSFVESFEPEDWGEPDRFEDHGEDEGLRVLAELVSLAHQVLDAAGHPTQFGLDETLERLGEVVGRRYVKPGEYDDDPFIEYANARTQERAATGLAPDELSDDEDIERARQAEGADDLTLAEYDDLVESVNARDRYRDPSWYSDPFEGSHEAEDYTGWQEK